MEVEHDGLDAALGAASGAAWEGTVDKQFLERKVLHHMAAAASLDIERVALEGANVDEAVPWDPPLAVAYSSQEQSALPSDCDMGIGLAEVLHSP